VERLRFGWPLLLASFIGCAGSAAPDDIAGQAGSAPVPASSGGTSGTGGLAPSGNSAGSSDIAGSGGLASAGVGGQLVDGGSMAGGAFSGSAGLDTGGTSPSAGGGAGGTTGVDPSLLPAVTLHLAGDSTVMTYAADSAQEGWGQELPQFLLAKVKINNQAIGGASVQTFYGGRWQNIMSSLHAGDYVAAAFGANDSGSVAGRHVDPPDFQAFFSKMATEVMAKQATFIAVTPSALQEWSGGVEGNQRLAPYVSVLHSFADASGVKLADLNARSLEFLNLIGQEAAKEIYIGGDKAHFTKKGATQMAQLVAQELKRIGSPLGAYVK
jgi:lysophospholipase L1-like esterase